MVSTVTDATFNDDVIGHNGIVIVDFWAEWCGPCRAIAPIFDALAEKFAGKVKFVKINVDDNSEMATQFNVRSIPTIIMFKNGQAVKTQVGGLSQSGFEEWINSSLSA